MSFSRILASGRRSWPSLPFGGLLSRGYRSLVAVPFTGACVVYWDSLRARPCRAGFGRRSPLGG
eukprot:7616881-Lingulodinium_polyedra.AAC.1